MPLPRAEGHGGKVRVRFKEGGAAVVRPFQLKPDSGVDMGFNPQGKLVYVDFPEDKYPGLDATVKALVDCPLCTEIRAMLKGAGRTPLAPTLKTPNAPVGGLRGINQRMPTLYDDFVPEAVGIVGGKAADEIVTYAMATRPSKWRDPLQTILGVVGGIGFAMAGMALGAGVQEAGYIVSLMTATESGARLVKSKAAGLGAGSFISPATPTSAAPSLAPPPVPLPPARRVVRGFQ